MLVQDRPPAVSILTLVKDAVSRLPNGEGNRSDIVTLLKDSQYLVPNIETSSLTTTVSGALDRLQNDADAPVKYDNNRKIWIYLHRAKTLDDFINSSEDSNNVKHQRQRQKRKFKLDSDPVLSGSNAETLPEPSASTVSPGSNKTVQKIIVKGSDGKVIPLSASTLQRLIEAGAIKPGTQIATPEFQPDSGSTSGIIRIVHQPNKVQPNVINASAVGADTITNITSPVKVQGSPLPSSTVPLSVSNVKLVDGSLDLGQQIVLNPEQFSQLPSSTKPNP